MHTDLDVLITILIYIGRHINISDVAEPYRHNRFTHM
jgi:hypothetical protein